jgi:DNA-directed RNA polymerase specialized sigma24 family protein
VTAEEIVSDAYDDLYGHRLTITNVPQYELQIRVKKYAIAFREHRLQSIDDSSVVGPAGMIDHSLRATDDEYASQECRELFSKEAVAMLLPSERRLYELYLEGKTYTDIARIIGLPYSQLRDQFKGIFVKLFDAMAKLVTLDNPSFNTSVLKTSKAAEEAMGRLPRNLSEIVRLTLVDKLPAAQIAVRLKLASAQEVAAHLDRAFSALGRMYRVKMPDALIAALAYKNPKRKDEAN